MATLDLSRLSWSLTGWTPDSWRLAVSMELGLFCAPEIASIPCQVPGSVQAALRAAGLLPDWNVGLNARLCEWVENRHWIFEAELPPWPAGEPARLCFEGLDGNCEIWLGNRLLGCAANAFVPHEFAFEPGREGEFSRLLRVIFIDQPRWLGQVGFTSQIHDWKPRFNYTWDWIPRFVQIGIWGGARLETGAAPAFGGLRFVSDYAPLLGAGELRLMAGAHTDRDCLLELRDGDEAIARTLWPAGSLEFLWDQLPVRPWQPNGSGEAKLYSLLLKSSSGESAAYRVGFKNVQWEPCVGAPADADSWICSINGEPTFLQGVNWTPIRPNFADLQREDYLVRLRAYHDLGVNCLRVWGGGFPEHDWLYEICDDLGILLWQDLPFSSSGIDNWPPEDPGVIGETEEICRRYAAKRQGHVSLLLWCGGNELQGALDGNPVGIGRPVTLSHPLIAAMAAVFAEWDPGRRFMPASASGPRFMAESADLGKGLHWDVHGPWKLDAVGVEPWQEYWRRDDALFRSELGNAGAQPADLMREYLGGENFFDARLENPYWQRFGWWFEIEEFSREFGDAWAIEDYVAWSQQRQAAKLKFVAAAVKKRFPACGGMLVWMGHDCFPCPVNTSLLDFYGRPKPAALALRDVFRKNVPQAAVSALG